jgi:UDP-2-acetamido-3-amino-2,3-dideoxy-glucuronate N-acetyltransferase
VPTKPTPDASTARPSKAGTAVRIHATAEVAGSAEIGGGTSIWNGCQVRDGARIGCGCILGKDVYIDFGVEIGDNVKIQNGASVFHGATIESGVFIGPGAILTNDKNPRAINADGSLKGNADWEVHPIRICYGASIGAGAIVLPGITVGKYALVGAGAVVTKDVASYALVTGNPARQVGLVCTCSQRLVPDIDGSYTCPKCASRFRGSEVGVL